MEPGSTFDDPPTVGTGPLVSVCVVGASGDLAKKKIFPALFALYMEGSLPAVRAYIPFRKCVPCFRTGAEPVLKYDRAA